MNELKEKPLIVIVVNNEAFAKKANKEFTLEGYHTKILLVDRIDEDVNYFKIEVFNKEFNFENYDFERIRIALDLKQAEKIK